MNPTTPSDLAGDLWDEFSRLTLSGVLVLTRPQLTELVAATLKRAGVKLPEKPVIA